MTQLLTLPVGASRPPDRDSPAEHRRAISDLLPSLPPAAAPASREAEAVARRLVAQIETCDGEIAALSRDAGPAELKRLTLRLAELETETPAMMHGRAELFALVHRELEIVRGMRANVEVIAQRRTRLYNLLRGLWLQLCLIHETALQDPPMVATIIERVAGLCGEIHSELEADQDDANSRLSQARAVAHSRLTVAGEISRASAVSSMVNPLK